MANQGDQTGTQGNRDRDMNSPAGTAGRQEKTGDQRSDGNRQTGEGTRRRSEEEDDSPLGTRNTNR
jgi:hypothetical protein